MFIFLFVWHYLNILSIMVSVANLVEEYLSTVEGMADAASINRTVEFRHFETAKFKAVDSNHDGQLNQTEFSALMAPFSTHEGILNVTVKQSMSDADADGNG